MTEGPPGTRHFAHLGVYKIRPYDRQAHSTVGANLVFAHPRVLPALSVTVPTGLPTGKTWPIGKGRKG